MLCLFPILVWGQERTQTIRGTVIDGETKQVLVGATVFVDEIEPRIGTMTDQRGEFRLENVPVGRRIVKCRYPEYSAYVSNNLILSSTRELVLEIALVQEIGESTTEEVVITARDFPTKSVNPLSVVSTRSFNAEETERYAASVNDPARMALSLPGVQQGGDETENDVIIRGNSSFGVLWRLEGIDIPNPNHFARPGTSGGGITVFSAQLLDRSDFSTGGMPAEYGNAIAGAYDVHLRKGNMENRQHRVKLGLLGLDFSTEGPFSKGRSSYLANYRYSTLSLLNKAGFELVGERVDNDFQDLSFNLAFNGDDKRSQVTVFGIGGLSRERYRPVEDPLERDITRTNHWEDRDRVSNMGATGITYTYLLDEKSYLKAVVAGMYGEIIYQYDTLNLENERFRYNTEKYQDGRFSASVVYGLKFSRQTSLKTGVFANQVFFTFFRQDVGRRPTSDITQDFLSRKISVEGEGNTQTFEGYAQVSHRFSNQLSVNAGANVLFLNLNNTAQIDPRFSLKFTPDRKQAIAFAYGIHSQMLPLGQYFYRQTDSLGNITMPNFNLDMIRSHHLILGYNYIIGGDIRVGGDIYFQRLFNVPVRADGSNWWMLNNQSGISIDPLISEGKGTNYGINAFLEKTFSNRIFFLLTGSRFESSYELADGSVYNSRFGTRFGSSLTLGKEFVFKNEKTLQAGFRTMYNGGFRYTPPDIAASTAEGRFVADNTRINEGYVDPYFRIDARISWRVNKKRFASVLNLDIQNVLDRRNQNRVGWDAVNNELSYGRHSGGFVPVLSYQMDF